MKSMLLPGIIVLLTFMTPNEELVGRWETKPSPKGNVTGALFKDDNSFEVYINKKPFTSGTFSYSAADSLFTFRDNGCNDAIGSYKLIFFSNADSIRFVAISDSCTERKLGMERTVLGRVKNHPYHKARK